MNRPLCKKLSGIHLAAFVIFVFVFLPAGANAQHTGGSWPQVLGPKRNSVSAETGLLKRWPSGGPPLLWRVEGLGGGIASVAVSSGRLYTVGYRGDHEFAMALETDTGQALWSRRIGKAVKENPYMRWLAQRTPTVDGDHVYVITADGDLFCLDAADGSLHWRKSYTDDFGAERPLYGFCDLPLVDGEKLICTPGAEDCSVVELNKHTGEVRRKHSLTLTEHHVPWGNYAATLLLDRGGVRQYVVTVGFRRYGIDADNGRLLWEHNGQSSRITPIPYKDSLICSRQHGRALQWLKFVRQQGRIEVVPQTKNPAQCAMFQDGGMVVVDGHLYMHQQNGIFQCLDADTAEFTWRKRVGGGMGTVLYADDRLYFRTGPELRLVEPNPEEYAVVSLFSIPDHRASRGSTCLALADAKLYVRDDARLFCYDVAENSLDAQGREPRHVKLSWNIPADERWEMQHRPQSGNDRAGDALYVPTPPDVVEKMLELAEVSEKDVVFDMGSGDGRVVIAAAKKHGARGVGVEIDPQLVKLSREKVKEENLEELVQIAHNDMFLVDLSDATVVTTFLYPRLMKRLMPQLNSMQPGSRLVSHHFLLPDIPPEKTLRFKSDDSGEEFKLYLWTTPLSSEEVATEQEVGSKEQKAPFEER